MTDSEFQELVLKKLEALDTLQKSVQNMQADVSELRQSQARMEFEQDEKLSALFDGYEVIKETLSDHTQRLQRIEDKLETHEIQIRVLDSTKANKRKAK